MDAIHAARDFDGLRAAVAGAHGVDENEVGLIEPGVLVVLQLVRGLRHGAIRHQLRAARTHAAHVHPHGSGTRAAVEAEGDRTLRGVSHAIERIGHVEDVRFGLAGGVLERHLLHGRGVVEGLAVDIDGVMGDDRSFIYFAADRGTGTGDTAATSAATARICGSSGRCGCRRCGCGPALGGGRSLNLSFGLCLRDGLGEHEKQ